MQLVPVRKHFNLKNISSVFFVIYLSLYIFFLLFPGIWTSKNINRSYVVAVYTLNTPNTPYFFVYNC